MDSPAGMGLINKKWSIFLVLAVIVFQAGNCQSIKDIRLGILTDCQYCNCKDNGVRYYALSLVKLDSCVEEFNALQLDGVFHLGDMIDHDFSSYEPVLQCFNRFRAPLHPVLGNHDYMIKSKYKEVLLESIGMNQDHYRIDYGLWTLIVLNGDDLSYFAPQTRQQRQERDELVSALCSGLRTNGMPWNGGIGKEQMRWLESQLAGAESEGRKVIVLCHFPIFPKGDHNLFNNREVFTLLNRYHCVKAYFNGHYHAGNYQLVNGIHLVNFKGMVNSKQNSFAVVTLTSDSILIKGYGREPDRKLGIRK
jgi:manganese-dependent ADP-ribose/CDP-alcohol diphosphatase